MSWYIKCLKNYVNFSGRARRKEYWMFVLFNVIFAFVANLLDILLHTRINVGLASYGVIATIYSLAVFIPGLAVCVRRLHDVGKSGAWFFILLIPVVGWIWLLILYCTDSQAGDNQYGPYPKEAQ